MGRNARKGVRAPNAVYRYSGTLRIRVVLADNPHNPSQTLYRCTVREMSTPDAGRVYTTHVGAPAYLEHAVDSTQAYTEAAHAALSFLDHEGAPVADYADYAPDGIGLWAISTSKTYIDRKGNDNADK